MPRKQSVLVPPLPFATENVLISLGEEREDDFTVASNAE